MLLPFTKHYYLSLIFFPIESLHIIFKLPRAIVRAWNFHQIEFQITKPYPLYYENQWSKPEWTSNKSQRYGWTPCQLTPRSITRNRTTTRRTSFRCPIHYSRGHAYLIVSDRPLNSVTAAISIDNFETVARWLPRRSEDIIPLKTKPDGNRYRGHRYNRRWWRHRDDVSTSGETKLLEARNLPLFLLLLPSFSIEWRERAKVSRRRRRRGRQWICIMYTGCKFNCIRARLGPLESCLHRLGAGWNFPWKFPNVSSVSYF